jgi:hypothetical protein
VNQPLLDLIAFAAGAIAVVVDRRRAVFVACLAVAVGLAPAAAIYGGGWAAVVVLGAGLAGAVAGPLAGLVARRMSPRPGLDPLHPVGARQEGLFGPRSARVAAGVIALIAASWVSFNVPVGSVTAVQGALFPAAFVFTCGVLRVFLARTVTDLSVGMAAIALAIGVAWLLRGGSGPLPDVAGIVAIVPVVGAVEGWLAARHRSPASSEPRP